VITLVFLGSETHASAFISIARLTGQLVYLQRRPLPDSKQETSTKTPKNQRNHANHLK
jgi:hypothetical protein